MNPKKVTIVIPTYNQVETLADAVESALSQTIPCEIIVVDDGNQNGTAALLKDYPVTVIHQVNKGLSSARNTGIMHATGEYVLPLDSDDILMDNCAEKLLQIAETTGADVVSGSFKEFGKSNAKVILMPAPTIEDFKMGNRIGYCSLIKKAVLLEVGGYSPRMTWGFEDYALWFDLLKRGKTFVTTPEILWLYRTKEISMMTESLKHKEELLAQITKDHGIIF